MKAYRVIEGYIQLRFTETGEIVEDAEEFPLSRFTILVDENDKETLTYLLQTLDVEIQELRLVTETPHYMTHELN